MAPRAVGRAPQAIAATLAEVRPDLCGLQEVWAAPGESLAAELAGRLGMHWCWAAAGEGRDSRGGLRLFIGNAILSRWPITAQAELRLPTGEHLARAGWRCTRASRPGRCAADVHHPPELSARCLRRCARQQVRAAGRVRRRPPHRLRLPARGHRRPQRRALLRRAAASRRPARRRRQCPAWCSSTPGGTPARPTPGFTWDHRNGYQADSLIPDSRIDYVLVGLPRHGRGRVQSVRLAGTAAVDGVWPSDHSPWHRLRGSGQRQRRCAQAGVPAGIPRPAACRRQAGRRACGWSQDVRPA